MGRICVYFCWWLENHINFLLWYGKHCRHILSPSISSRIWFKKCFDQWFSIWIYLISKICSLSSRLLNSWDSSQCTDLFHYLQFGICLINFDVFIFHKLSLLRISLIEYLFYLPSLEICWINFTDFLCIFIRYDQLSYFFILSLYFYPG